VKRLEDEEGKMRELIGLWKAPTAGVPRALCALERAAMRHTGERRRHSGAASEPYCMGYVGMWGQAGTKVRRDNHEIEGKQNNRMYLSNVSDNIVLSLCVLVALLHYNQLTRGCRFGFNETDTDLAVTRSQQRCLW
jgi:hypothetical protein